jgi:protein-S-isoprenylcysteine O-methyltransferase Ste14
MARRPLQLFLSATGYAGFLAVVVWTVCFLAGVLVPRTVDGPTRLPTAAAVAVDTVLLLLFAVQHSVMARRQVKSALRRWIPESLERTTYVLATDLCLVVVLLFWQPFGWQLWHVDGVAAVAAWSLYAAGWTLAIASTVAVDHLDLVGLRQGGWAPRRPDGVPRLQVGGLHGIVRHPLMTGMILAFWATPHLGVSHLYFALVSTGYIAVGIAFEERDLRRTFGTAYDDYAARVPALVPTMRHRTGSSATPSRVTSD